MTVRLLLSILCMLLLSCTKSQIQRRGCTGDAGYVEMDSCSMFINNIMTPNGDGINDNFPIYCGCPGASEFSIRVKKRGKILFETTNPTDELWDGTFEGELVKEGMYDFVFEALVGDVNLIQNGTIAVIHDTSEPVKINSKDCVWSPVDPLVIK